ncbi:MAG: hypothetical protein JWO36_5353 [Myxococcales bacterium]|nr:hypothetical protein [Myxococcales bacterium]
MGKWLAACGAVLLVLVVLLWYQMQSTAAVVPTASATLSVATHDVAPAQASTKVVPIAAAVAMTAQTAGKIDPASDAFFNQFTDKVPSIVTGNAIRKCYQGGLHRRDRDQFLTLEFVDHIKNGEVTVSDVKIKKSELNDPTLEACMIAAVAASHWHDDSLPDISQADEVTINPERIVKKYVDDSYEGAPAPPNTPR